MIHLKAISAAQRLGNSLKAQLTINNNNLASIPLIYESSLTNMARVYGFNAKYPLQIKLGNSSYRSCREFYKDESYTAEEFIAFHEKYAGASVELSGVQRHFGMNGPLACTFTGFKVLASGEEAEMKPVLDRDTILATRTEIKKVGSRAMLKNVQMT